MARPPLLDLLRLVQTPDAPPPRPLALVGRGRIVDAVAAALLAEGGDRRALAPLPAAGPDLLRGCVGVIACGLSLDGCRSVARAHRPWVALLNPTDDRYAFGALPRLGALAALPPLPDAQPDVHGAIATIIARLDADDAATLAARLPVLARPVAAQLAGATARRAAAIALVGGPGAAMTVAQARTTLAQARLEGLPGGHERIGEVAAVAATALGLASFGRRSGRPTRAVIAYGGTWAALAAAAAVRRRAR